MHSNKSSEAKLRKILIKYSFDDLAKSFFTLNLWLPNIANFIKSEYLYVQLGAIAVKLQTENRIKDYKDFHKFCTEIIELIPSFPSIEDYMPERDWGNIKYYFKEKYYKIFYAANLSNPYDYYYSFEVIHTPLDEYYTSLIKRSPLQEFKFCLQLQEDLLNKIYQTADIDSNKCYEKFTIPPVEFWQESIAFIDDFNPVDIYEPELVELFVYRVEKDFQEIGQDEFLNNVFEGGNCLYYFMEYKNKYYPVLPRNYFTVLMAKWSKLLKEHYNKILELMEIDKKSMEIELCYRLSLFLHERVPKEEFLGLASPLDADMNANELMFNVIQNKNKLFFIHLLPLFISGDEIKQQLQLLSPKIQECRKLLEVKPIRLGLHIERKMIEFLSNNPEANLEPVFIFIIPTLNIAPSAIPVPSEFMEDKIIMLDQFLGLIDEVQDIKELVNFFEFKEELDKSSILSPIQSLLDEFGSYRDSNKVLVSGAHIPTNISVDTSWGSNIRYRTLSEFWRLFPEEPYLKSPRAWNIMENRATESGIMLKLRNDRIYVYYQPLYKAVFFVSTQMHLMDLKRAQIADNLIHGFVDSLEQYAENLKNLVFTKAKITFNVIIFPASLVEQEKELSHVLHLMQKEKIWMIDCHQLGLRNIGIRVVYNDDMLINALQGATDRSLQIQFLTDILREMNQYFQDRNLDAVELKLQAEKLRPARFKIEMLDKKVSFPEHIKVVLPEEREFKIAENKMAFIANNLNIMPGIYEGDEAKTKINNLKEKLIEEIDACIATYDLKKSLPVLIRNIDALTFDYDMKTQRIKLSLTQEVDYAREERTNEIEGNFFRYHRDFRYLIEKFVQLQPTGTEELTEIRLQELIAMVDRLLGVYFASDNLYYGIYPVKVKIEYDYIVTVEYGEDIANMEKELGIMQAQIAQGVIGNKDDTPDNKTPIINYIDSLSLAFKKNLGFSLEDLLLFEAVLTTWPAHNDNVPESTHYSASLQDIKETCGKSVKDLPDTVIEGIAGFLTLMPEGLLKIEGDDKEADDLPVWEHNKRLSRYILKPLIKVEDNYYWGPFSIERNSMIWRNIVSNHRLPADIVAEDVKVVLLEGHSEHEKALEEKTAEIVKRFTPFIRANFYPHTIDATITDIGDIDVLAFIKDKNILLNIEAKVIDRFYNVKDMRRAEEKVYGRTKSNGTFEKGYLQKVEEREKYIKKEYSKVMVAMRWQQNIDPPRIVSIFLTRMTHLWTKFPSRDTSVNFVEIRMLQEFISKL